MTHPRSCATCARPIVGQVHFEPLGKDDAIVALCSRCAVDEVPDPEPYTRRVVGAYEASTPRAIKVRERRELLAADGVCVSARSHGKATHGRYCEPCFTRQQLLNRAIEARRKRA